MTEAASAASDRSSRVHVPERSVPGAEPELREVDKTAPAQATEEVLVLDFGGQYSQLIARRIRECGVFSELLPHDTPLERIKERGPKGLVLSGRARLGLRRRRPGASQGAARSRDPGAGHLLRHAADGPRAGRPGRAGPVRRVRPQSAHPPRRWRQVARGPAGRAAVLDEPPRHRLRAAPRLHRPGLEHRVTGRCLREHRARACTAFSSTPRSSTLRTAPRSSPASSATSWAPRRGGRPPP